LLERICTSETVTPFNSFRGSYVLLKNIIKYIVFRVKLQDWNFCWMGIPTVSLMYNIDYYLPIISTNRNIITQEILGIR
jgi:hypothetical protein